MPVKGRVLKKLRKNEVIINHLVLVAFLILLLPSIMVLAPNKVLAQSSSISEVYAINTIAGTGSYYLGTDDGGPATKAVLRYPQAVSVDSIGNIYITDDNRIRKIDAVTGIISTIAGTIVAGYSGDGGPATAAQFNSPNGIAVDNMGNIYIDDLGNNRIRMINKSSGNITTIAGTGVAGYSGDGGLATAALLNMPVGVAVDSTGNVYISDTYNSRVRMVDKATGIISTMVGTGVIGHSGDGGAAISAQIKYPYGVAFDSSGNIYIDDEYDHCIRKVDKATGIITNFAGSTQGYSGDGGPANAAKLNYPSGVAVDSSGNVYISDTDNYRVRMVEKATGIIRTIAGTGVVGYSGNGGPAAIAQLTSPLGINVDSTGKIYVVDQNSYTIRAINLTSPFIPPVLTPAIISIKFGQSTNLTFTDSSIWRSAITGISIDGVSLDSSLYTVSSANINIASSVFTTAGDHSIVVKATGFNDAKVTQNMMDALIPPNLAASNDNTLGQSTNLTFTDDEAWRSNITGITVNGTALNSNQYSMGAGNINIPASVFTTAGDYTIVIKATGYNNATLVKTMVTSSTSNVYTINTIGGNGVQGYFGDGASATTAKLNTPSGVAVDDEGNVYIADTNNNRVRMIERSTGIIRTIAGTGTAGFSGDGGPATASQLAAPRDVTVDSSGNVYIVDSGNNRVRMVDKTAGIITTVAGGASDNLGDGGPAIGAGLISPSGIAIDSSGNLYISDYIIGYGSYRIRMVDKTTGIISTIPGKNPNGVTVDGIGHIYLTSNSNVYMADKNNNRVSMFDNSTGMINNIAGTGISGYSGDGGVATVAKLSGPSGVAIDSLGNIYIADTNNNRIRVLSISSSKVITAPALSAPSTNIIIGQSVNLSFIDDPTWRNAINQITVDDKPLSSSQYSVSAGNIYIDASVFITVGDHVIVVNAAGYYPTVSKINLLSYGSTEVSNFDISLNPYTSDYPTVIVRKHDTFVSATYGDSKGIEPVNFWFTKDSNGKYYCRYSTSSTSYPLSGGLVELIPASTGEIDIKIFGRGRVSDTDMAGLSIQINNDTDLIPNVQISGDDPAFPRVHSIIANQGHLKVNLQEVPNVLGYPAWPSPMVLKGNNSFAPLIPFGDSSDALYKKVLSPNGQMVATVGWYSPLLQLWNTSDGTLIKTLTDHISSFSYNHDGSILVSNFQNTISLWNTSDGSLIKSIDLPYSGYSFSYISLNSDLSMLAGNSLGTVFIWDLLHGKLLSSITNVGVGGGDLSPDGKFLITSTSNSLRIWNTNDGTLSKEIPYNNFSTANNSFSQDGSLFTTISQNLGTTNIWQTSDWSLVKTINIKAKSAILSPDNKLLAVYDGSQLQMVNINDGSIVSVLVQSKSINTLTFSNEGKYLAACDTNNGTKIWTVADGKLILSIPDWGPGIAFNTSGDELSIIHNGISNFTETIPIETSSVNPSASISIIRLKDGENFGYQDIPLFINVSSCTDLGIYVDGKSLNSLKFTGRYYNLNGYLITGSLIGGSHLLKFIATDANGNQISREVHFSTSEKAFFEKPWYSVNENDGSVQINVNRESGDGTLQVKYHTSDPGAAGRFQAQQGILNYADGERVKTISIPINDDQICNGNAGFIIYLTSDDSNSTNLDWTAVTIVDDEVSETLTPPILTPDSTHNTIGQSINITFADDATWRAAISTVFVDDNWLNPNSNLYTITPGNINLAASLFTTPGDHTVAIYAQGYYNANLTQTMVGLTAPVLTATSTNNYIGQSVNLTFTDNAPWRSAVSGVIVDSRPLSSGQYTVTSGNINIAAGVFSVPGNHTVIVKATNYYDTTLIQNIRIKLVAPVLTASNANISGQPINITFSDDPTWRGTINIIVVDGTDLNSSQYTVISGSIKIAASAITTTGDHTILISATGYYDTFVTINATYIINTTAGTGTPGYLGDGVLATVAELGYSPSNVAVDGNGNIYLADTSNNRIRKIDKATGKITTIAGTGVAGYSGDGGAATAAQLYDPTGLVVDSIGNIYISDQGNNCIRKIDKVTGKVSTVGRNVNDNNYPTLKGPGGLAIDHSDNIYIVDTFDRICMLDKSTGNITVIAGKGGYSGYAGDGGPATAAELYTPEGVAVDSTGNIYIADTQNNRIRMINKTTGIITTIAGTGVEGFSGDEGPATAAQLDNPSGVAIDSCGNVYIADSGNNRIRKINQAGIITTKSGTGVLGFSGDGGLATSAQMNSPRGVAVDNLGNIYFADAGNNRVRVLSVGTPVLPATILTADTSNNMVGQPVNLTFADNPAWRSAITGISVDGTLLTSSQYTVTSGNIKIVAGAFTTFGDHTVMVQATEYNSSIITQLMVPFADYTINTIAGTDTLGYSGDGGSAITAQLSGPTGVVVDKAGNIYIADTSNSCIRMIDKATGKISTLAGTGVAGFSGDGGAAIAAQLNNPFGIVVDSIGNIYIADTGNQRIRMINKATGFITTIAGNGVRGFSGDGWSANLASLYSPTGVAVDSNGNIYIADKGNNRIRKIDKSTGNISTICGTGVEGSFGDGGAAIAARLYNPNRVAVDRTGNIYIVDWGNSRIRKIDNRTGTITTIAGTSSGFSGDGGAATTAKLFWPSGIAFDRTGNIYIADTDNHRVRMVDVSGNIITIAGNGKMGFSGDGRPSTLAQLYPSDVAVDDSGNIYLTDPGSNRVRVLIPITTLAPPALIIATTSNILGQSVNITFTDNDTWLSAISSITVDGISLNSNQYSVTTGNINISAEVFTSVGDYTIVIKANGYNDASVTQTMVAAPSSFTASSLVKVGTNPDKTNSEGIIVGLQNITDSTDTTSSNPSLNGYQTEIDFDPLKVKILDVNALATFGNFQIDRQNGKVIISDRTTGSAILTNIDKLFFVSLDLIGNANDSTNVNVNFSSATDQNGNSIDVSQPATLNFQRGKIGNDGTTKVGLSDALAGLQYLAKLQDESQINVVNMASILPLQTGANCIKPSVKDVIALMQYLVGSRDSNFNPVSN